jgi:hypothetical protein
MRPCTIESHTSRFTVSLETCLLSELMTLIPSAFIQVRDHATIGRHCSKCQVSLKTYNPSEHLVLVPYASAEVYDHVPLRDTLLLLIAEVTH